MHRRRFLAGAGGAFAVALAGCGGGAGVESNAGLTLAATPFDDGGTIPSRYTCDGGDVNPELTIGGVPESAETLALVVDDPDADERPSVHWLLWNVPASTETIPRSVDRGERPPFADGARQGENDAGAVGYVGPCPPTDDDAHSYRFRLSAVETSLEVDAGAGYGDLASALDEHAVDSVTLTARYGRD